MKESKKKESKPKKETSKFNAAQYCGISKLSRGGRRYMNMKYGQCENKVKSTWDNIVKKDKVF